MGLNMFCEVGRRSIVCTGWVEEGEGAIDAAGVEVERRMVVERDS